MSYASSDVRFRRLIMLACLIVIAYLAALTGWVAASSGPDVLTVLSFLILFLFGFGIVGALREMTEDDDQTEVDPEDRPGSG